MGAAIRPFTRGPTLRHQGVARGDFRARNDVGVALTAHLHGRQLISIHTVPMRGGGADQEGAEVPSFGLSGNPLLLELLDPRVTREFVLFIDEKRTEVN